MRFAPLLLALLAVPAWAQEAIDPDAFAGQHTTFETYWYQGLAELSRYRLEQARYGEVHPGEAVLVYVTEEFDGSDQVKWDHGERDDIVPILKLNAYRRFYTGIYPYTIMTGVFWPVAEPDATPIKLSHSTVEWCGQVYSQLNRRDGQWQYELRSYFQSEGDQDSSLPLTITEDGLWTLLRRDPSRLPTGPLNILPALHFLRLMHQPAEAQPAEATLEDVASSPYGDAPARLYTLTYPLQFRTLRIWFEPAFPYQIVAWEEESPANFGSPGANPELITTRAVLTNAIMLDYWAHHDLDDAALREALGLEW